MKEELLHYIWKTKNFDHRNLRTTAGEKVEIIDFGMLNHNAGPDFLNAKVKIHDKLWAGHIEIHIKSSDWEAHKHQEDEKYNSVILHVVHDANKAIRMKNDSVLPQLELKNRINDTLLEKYDQIIKNKAWIPCQSFIPKINPDNFSVWLHKLTIERIEKRFFSLESQLESLENNWEQLFFSELSRAMGLKINAEAFEVLASVIHVDFLRKYKGSSLQIEALFFGQSGLLPQKSNDEYVNQCLLEYKFLMQKHSLTPMSPIFWNFLRLRPSNFPTIRISQLATLFSNRNIYFNEIIDLSIIEIQSIFHDVGVSTYWETHYVFDKESPKRQKRIGKERIALIIINAIVPLLFLYGKKTSQERYSLKALDLLDSVKSESNSIITNWKNLGIKCKSAYDSQALLELKKEYCDQKRCTNCSIGHYILNKL